MRRENRVIVGENDGVARGLGDDVYELCWMKCWERASWEMVGTKWGRVLSAFILVLSFVFVGPI